jgi:DNA polymerase-3 subunit delta
METPGGEVVGLCQTLPCMSPRRLVIVKEFESYKAADLESLIAYCAAPSETTCLVMIANERKYDKRAFTAAVESGGGAVVVFYALHESDLSAWISDWARARGLTIRSDAVEYVKQTLGTDLQKINNELLKVEISLKDRKAIALDDVRQVVGDFRDYSAFDLVEAVGKKDRERAFLILGRILHEGEQPVGLLAMMAWNFRRLIKAQGMEGAGCGYDEIKRKLNVLYFQSASFQQQMRRFSPVELRRSFRVMLAADRALKSSGLAGGLVLERMILELCGK